MDTSVVAAAKRPFIKSKLQRVIESAIENAQEQKLDAQLDLNDARGNMVKSPASAGSYLDQIVVLRGKIINADKTIAALNAEKKELFQTVVEEDEDEKGAK